MSTLNTTKQKTVTRTHEGGVGRKAEVREELALLALSTFLGDSFYESGNVTLDRMRSLVSNAPASFVTQLARVARQEFNMRATPAALMAFFLLEHGQPQNDAQIIKDVFFRGDEIHDFLAVVNRYSDNKNVISSAVRFGRKILQSTMTERKALRYSLFNRKWHLEKAIRLTHARAGADEYHRALFEFVLSWKGEGSLAKGWEALAEEYRVQLPLIAKAASGEDVSGEISWERSRTAGASWEDLVGQLGYMALIRNLNNLFINIPADNAELWKSVVSRIGDEAEVANSRQLPFRFLSANRAIRAHQSHRWYNQVSTALEQAIEYSLGSIPRLEGSTLVIVDTSGSMDHGVSAKSQISYVDIGSLFGAAMFKAQNATVVAFGTDAEVMNMNINNTTLSNQEKLLDIQGRERRGYGTDLESVNSVVNVNDYDNLIIFSDMQVMDYRNPFKGYSGNVFSVNLAAYETQLRRLSPKQWDFGGWSDSSVTLMSTLAQEGGLVKFVENY